MAEVLVAEQQHRHDVLRGLGHVLKQQRQVVIELYGGG